MASSVARMPSDEWRHRHPSRLHVHAHKPLPKVLTRISASIDPSAEPLSPATAAKRRQSRILDRWAARQARDMITTIERQTHEAELSALSTTTQPVSARAASFLRDTSPDSPAAAAAAAAAAAVGIPATVRASSLIQMWREMEAEAGVVCSTPRAPAAAAEERSGGSDACEEAESEIAERRKVGDIVRMLSGSESPAKEVAAALLPSPPDGGSPEMEGFVLKMLGERRREVAELGEGRLVSRFPFRGRIQSLIRLRSLRQEVTTIRHQQWSQKLEAKRFETRSNNFFLRERPEDRRQHDINEVPTEESMSVMEVQPSDSPVSVFAIPIDHSDGENSRFSELDSTREIESSPQAFHSPQTFFTPLSRHEDLQESQSYDASWDERSLWGSGLDWQRPSDSHMLQTWHGEVAPEGTGTSTLEQHVASAECNWLLQPSNSSRRTFYKDLINTNFAENGEIQELLEMKTVSTSLASEFSTKMNQMISSFLHRQGQQYADMNGREECEEQGFWRQNYGSSYDQEAAAATSLTQLSSAMFHNQESWQNTSLSLSPQILQNQESWQSISLPLPSQMLQRQKSWQSSSFTQNSSPSVQEGEDIHDLKNSVAQMHHEISEIRKLVESCLDWQKKLNHTIKQEVFSAVNQLAGRGNLLHNSKCIQGRTDTCCICCEAQVDTILYRCGHMCACYNCAQELQWSSGRCPICRSLIADVIRAYPKS